MNQKNIRIITFCSVFIALTVGYYFFITSPQLANKQIVTDKILNCTKLGNQNYEKLKEEIAEVESYQDRDYIESFQYSYNEEKDACFQYLVKKSACFELGNCLNFLEIRNIDTNEVISSISWRDIELLRSTYKGSSEEIANGIINELMKARRNFYELKKEFIKTTPVEY